MSIKEQRAIVLTARGARRMGVPAGFKCTAMVEKGQHGWMAFDIMLGPERIGGTLSGPNGNDDDGWRLAE